MAQLMSVRVCIFCRNFQNLLVTPLASGTALWSNHQVRHGTGKHYDPKWRNLRWKKVFYNNFKLPDFEEIYQEQKLSPEESRSKMKKRGIAPQRDFKERNILISSTSNLFEPYVPPEGDGVASPVSKEGAKQRLTELEKKGKSFMQVRKIKSFDEDFSTAEFADTAQDIYIEAQALLADIKENEDRLHDLVTEKAYPEMTWKLKNKTYMWKFVESLEPPRVVHVRTTQMISKENVYAQVTVRFNTQQILAIYDRFGRLMFGSPTVPKDCLEYVVYEKHLSDEYGKWRIHGKIIPDWMPPRQQVLRTIRKPDFEPIPDDAEAEKTEEVKVVEKTSPSDGPQLATA